MRTDVRLVCGRAIAQAETVQQLAAEVCAKGDALARVSLLSFLKTSLRNSCVENF
jgi:hypothetical protein